MRDRTAMTEPLTIGQRLVARWEGLNSGWSEPADLAEAIDDAIAAEREACASVVEKKWQEARDTDFDLGFETARKCFAAAIPSRS